MNWNMVLELQTAALGDHCVMMPSLDHQKSNFSLIFGNLSDVGY